MLRVLATVCHPETNQPLCFAGDDVTTEEACFLISEYGIDPYIFKRMS